MMQKFRIKRKICSTQATLGVWYDSYGNKICRTLENPWRANLQDVSCIPEGTYNVVRDDVGKFKYFRILGVPNRTLIEIHNGNYEKDTRGCILVGEHWAFLKRKGADEDEWAVTNSKNTIEKLSQILPDKFELTITREDY